MADRFKLKTDRFKKFLQINMSKVLNGVKEEGEEEVPISLMSEEDAYRLFRESFDSIVEFTRNQEDLKVPISGIGTFSIELIPPKKLKGEVNSIYKGFEKIPHYKWKPSKRFRQYLDSEFLGIASN